MSEQHIIFSPERNQWTLSDGRHHMEVPEWARDIVRDEAECETKSLRAENDKLRELVKALLTCATDGDCDECRLNGATPWHVGKAQLCDGVWDRVRELGVEVE